MRRNILNVYLKIFFLFYKIFRILEFLGLVLFFGLLIGFCFGLFGGYKVVFLDFLFYIDVFFNFIFWIYFWN